VSQNTPIGPAKLRKIAAADALLRPFLAFAPRPRAASSATFPPRRILVIELWGIGDVILATPLLAELRDRFPGAEITLLAKPHARELLAGSGLVDEVIAFDFPWTAFSEKYAPRRYDPSRFRELFRDLRARSFDVSLDARRDLRSNIVAYLGGAARRIGYDFGGGSWLLTDVVPSGSQDGHRTDDWLALLQPLLGETPPSRPTVLRVTDDERTAARLQLRAVGILGDRRLVAIDAGSAAPARRLREEVVVAAASDLLSGGDVDVLFNIDPSDYGSDFRLPPGVKVLRPTLRELVAILAEADALVCGDSAAMHIAGALGTPITAVLGPYPRHWLAPRESRHRLLYVEEMPCRPCFDACIYPSPLCTERIPAADVIAAVRSQLPVPATLN
jgi:ADP-heptose:LPS heptosyltransferase